ncbi:hypothetical protein AAZX31_07G194800 [Glycine max]|uniref:Cyclin-dependent kinase inhibitor domain-containing protein n=1 Tax=Glycine max TaxID=3847 RepID=I1KLY5_SOYBN|nr:cyclin-dependent kinase inhibitor 7 [Glycine max]KAG5010755.1 hypothetical protein JHK87_019270 [Glycine soja]KAG5023495.1 hypothetical protein JHK85_019837 [Glycine max]KAG5038572.1 hypothetical protein JHK86_019412 [Glycine max]KAG5143701.1 hypothetical protein JHK82_019396 [Glycine max]KAH1243161.1 Cyclin-dependent kinase inhibitor 7 [Glycine max]|eukprot:XP_003529390.1 cyclin-dependent kinase inhibitor 7 [Glycine max]
MGECKRCCSLTVLAMEEPSSSQHSIFKKRKTTATAAHSTSFQLCSSDMQFPHTIVSPEVSFSSACTVVSGEFCSDRSCCSSSHVKDLHSVPSDLQTKGFETVEDSTSLNFKSFSLLSEFSGDSEESAMIPAKSSAAVLKVKTPPKAEIEEFFAMAEKYEQKRFTEKYNFDIVRDLPLEGRYQWVRLH